MVKNGSFAFAASALVLGSALGFTAAFAADFPSGDYEASGLILTFDGKGQFHVNQGTTTQVSGTYSVKGGQLEMTDQKGPWACSQAGQQTGTYNWKYQNAVLTLDKVTDSCDARSGTLTPGGWKHKK